MKLKEYIKVVDDCTKALTVVPPDVIKREREKEKLEEEKAKMEGRKVYEKDPISKIITNPQLTNQLQLKLRLRRGKAYVELDEPEKGKLMGNNLKLCSSQ